MNPDEIVAIGAAYWAASLLKNPMPMGLPTGAIQLRRLGQDLGIETVAVCKFSGEETSWFHVILPAQTPIPTTKLKRGFTTSKAGQKDAVIKVFQGEGRFTTDEDVEEIGTFTIPLDTTNQTVDEPKVDVEFLISDDNILTVKAGQEGKEMTEIHVGEV